MDTPQTLLARARQCRLDDKPEEAFAWAEEALRLAEASSERRYAIAALKFMGQIRRDQGAYDAALSFYLQAEDRARADGDPLLLAHTIRHVGDIHWDMGDADLAEPCFEEALALYRENSPSPAELANALRPMALLKEAADDKAAAYDLWEEAGALYAAAGIDAGMEESARRMAALSAGP